jgi:CubicO group peptidase (beta-lactamase class C family)
MIRFLLLAWLLTGLARSGVAADVVFPGDDWETASPDSQGMDAGKLDQARAWLESHRSKSGLVVRHGRIVAEWYFGDARRTSKFAAYSTTKSLSSLATGLAIAEGQLALDHTVGRYLPDAAPDPKKSITVKQLLSMTSGVHNDSGINQRADLFSYALKEVAMDFEPGSKWEYNNTGLSLLSPVFQKAVGRPIDEYFDAKVFVPIGIRSDDWTWERREGYALPYSGCHLTSRAMGRIGLLVLNRGKWNDRQIVPSSWLAESVQPSQSLNPSYGYLWWNNTTKKWPGVPADAFAALGRWDNNILVAPSLDLVVIRQSDLEPEKGHNIGEYFRLVCEAVRPQAAK